VEPTGTRGLGTIKLKSLACLVSLLVLSLKKFKRSDLKLLNRLTDTWLLTTQWWRNESATNNGNATPSAGRNATADAGTNGANGPVSTGSNDAVYGATANAGSGSADPSATGSGAQGINTRAGLGIDADVKI